MSEDAVSEGGSFHSDYYADVYPELVGEKAPVYKQSHSPQGFKRWIMTGHTEFEEAYTGACATVCSLNPDLFQIPYGTRVINIKTEHEENVHRAVNQSIWTTLKAISERIMEVWNARREPSEKVLFLFSINGAKQFCGLAEMSGAWNAEVNVDGWTDPSKGFVGTIPLTWVYVKNVPYIKFAHLKHGAKGQPIANMWSGQSITPSEPLGRQVVDIYISEPHVTNILAWPTSHRGHMQIACLGNGNNRSVQNVRALRGEHAGQRGRGGAKATDRNWRVNDNDQPPVGRIIGEVDINEPVPIAARRNGKEFTVNTAPLPQTDGTFESVTAARPGHMVTCVVNEHGDYVPVSPRPDTANSVTHMPDRDYFKRFGQQTRSVEDMRGGFRGGFRGGRGGGMRGGHRGGMHGGMRGGIHGRQVPITINNYYGQSDKPAGLGIDDPQELHHADSNATIKSRQTTVPGSTHGSKLQQAAFAQEFVPKSDANRSLNQAVGGADSATTAQQGRLLRHAPSNMSFASQAQQYPPLHRPTSVMSPASPAQPGQHRHHAPSHASFASNMQATNPTSYGDMNMQSVQDALPCYGQNYAQDVDKRSQDSYPSHFRSADSMAGYNARPAPYQAQKMQQAPMIPHAQHVPPPPLMRNLGEKTPTHLPKHADLKQKTEDWVEKTPTHLVFPPTAVEGASVPLTKRATYYNLMADKAEIEHKLAGMSMDDQADYYRTLAHKAEVENRIVRLTLGKDERSGSSSVGSHSRDSSVAEGTTVSSINVRAEDGRTLPSVSEVGKAPATARRAKHASHGSLDARIKNDLDNLLASPPDSTKADHQASPSGSVAAESIGETEVTNPFSEGDGTGGIRLEN